MHTIRDTHYHYMLNLSLCRVTSFWLYALSTFKTLYVLAESQASSESSSIEPITQPSSPPASGPTEAASITESGIIYLMISAVIIAVLTYLFYMILSTAQHKRPDERRSEGCAMGAATSSSTPSSQVTERTASSSVPTSDYGATVSGSGLVGDKAQEIREKAAQLQDMFVTVVMHAKMCFIKKEEESMAFLMEFKSMLEDLPLSNRYKHLHFLEEEKDRINMANNVKEILNILRQYWNYVDYAFLERIIKEFGTGELKKEMMKYMMELEVFEKKTSVKDYNSVAPRKIQIPAHFETVTLKQDKDPAQCSLYEVRQLKNEMTIKANLEKFSTFFSVSCSSVHIVLAFPREAHKDILVVLDKEFMKIHQLEVRPYPPRVTTPTSYMYIFLCSGLRRKIYSRKKLYCQELQVSYFKIYYP